MADEEQTAEQGRDPDDQTGSDEEFASGEDRDSQETGSDETRGSNDHEAGSEEDRASNEERGPEDISGTTAPSVGPRTTFEREDPEERLARHEQSTEDAMGLDKRRSVVGGQYGASAAKQATLYGGALAIIAALVIGFIILVGALDTAPSEVENSAPWSDPSAPQTSPDPLE